jgi:tetratricopeptide (TPR) repeat protein
METTRGWKIAVTVLLLLATSSCRFKLPNTSEGQLLAKQGTFPKGLPDWVKTPDEMGAAEVGREGLVPQTFGAPKVVQTANQAQANTGIASATDEREERMERVKLQRAAEPAPSTTAEAEQSPLDRVETTCPGTEKDVSAALQVENVMNRIEAYESLTNRCADSSDLWFWLARDYQEAGKNAQAIRAYEKVLVLDPKNQAARALLDEARTKGNRVGGAVAQ